MRAVQVLLIIGIIVVVHGQRLLTTKTFEHDTQAATGQTTGVWLIRFCAKTSEECNKFGDEWHELADELLEEQIWAADVDVDDSPEVAERFQIFSAPTYILLRNRKMLIKHSTGSKTELWEWALDGWQAQHSLEVPPARMTGFATIESLASQGAAWHMLVNKLSGGGTSLMLGLALLGTVIAIVILRRTWGAERSQNRKKGS